MPGFLKQATASQARALGPFVDDTDFKTAKTGLTIANTDIKLVVNGAASANKNSGGGTHRVNGVYGVTFDATDTATVGELEVSCVVASALPVFDKYFVVEEAVYDMLFGASAIGYTANQPVDMNTVKTQAITAAAGVTFPASIASPTNITAGVITTVSGNVTGNVGGNVTGSVGSVVGAVGSVTGAVGSVTGNVGGNVTGSVGSVVGAVGSVTGAVGSVTGNVGGNVTGSVGSVTGLTASNLDATISSRGSAANLAIVAGYIDTEIGDIQARLPAALTGAGNLKVDMLATNGSTNAAANLARGTLGNVLGTVGVGSTTTSIVTSALDPAAATADQFKGRILTFGRATTTANLRGQSTDITASSNGGVLTVTALTDAPVSGDDFVIT